LSPTSSARKRPPVSLARLGFGRSPLPPCFQMKIFVQVRYIELSSTEYCPHHLLYNSLSPLSTSQRLRISHFAASKQPLMTILKGVVSKCGVMSKTVTVTVSTSCCDHVARCSDFPKSIGIAQGDTSDPIKGKLITPDSVPRRLIFTRPQELTKHKKYLVHDEAERESRGS
jgi:hypothetical protein